MRSGSMKPIFKGFAAGWAASGAASPASRARTRTGVAFEAMEALLAKWARMGRSEAGADVELEALEPVPGQGCQVLGVDEAQRQPEDGDEEPQLGARRTAQVVGAEFEPLGAEDVAAVDEEDQPEGPAEQEMVLHGALHVGGAAE